jgi:hypothetical protein
MTIVLPVGQSPCVEIVNFGRQGPELPPVTGGVGHQAQVRSEGGGNPTAEVVVSDRSLMVAHCARLRPLVVLSETGLELAHFDGFL